MESDRKPESDSLYTNQGGLFRNASRLFTGDVAASALMFVSYFVAARALGEVSFGVIAFAAVYAALIDGLVNFQTWQAVVRYGTEAIEAEQHSKFLGIVKAGLLLDFSSAVVAGLAGVLIATCISAFNVWEERIPSLFLFSALIVFNVAGTPRAVLQIFDEYVKLSTARVLASLVQFILIVSGYFWGLGFWFFCVTLAVKPGLETIAISRAALGALADRKLRFADALTLKQTFMQTPGVGRFLFDTNLSGSLRLLSRDFDVLAVGTIVGVAAAGHYRLAIQVAGIPLKVAEAVQASLFSDLAKRWSRKEYKAFARSIGRGGFWTACIAAAFLIGFAILGGKVLDATLGNEFGPVYGLSLVLSIAQLIFMLGVGMRPAVLSMGRSDAIWKIYAICTLAHIICLFASIGTLETYSAPLARLVFNLIWFPLMALVIIRGMRSRVSERTSLPTLAEIAWSVVGIVVGKELQLRIASSIHRMLRFIRSGANTGLIDAKICQRLHLDGHSVFFGYYDISPFSLRNDRVLALAVPADGNDTTPAATIGYFDLQDGSFAKVDTTRAWCWQQGCRAQWLSHEAPTTMVFNANGENGYEARLFDVEQDRLVKRIPFPIFSLVKSKAYTLNFIKLGRLRPGYGYPPINDAAETSHTDDGLFEVDIWTDRRELLVSLADLAALDTNETMERAEHYINCITPNPSGTALLFFHRWCRQGKRYGRLVHYHVQSGVLSVAIPCVTPSHFGWGSDVEFVLYAEFAEVGWAYCRHDVLSKQTTFLDDPLLRADGHPSYSPDREWMITDTYPDRFGEQSLILHSNNKGSLLVGKLRSSPAFHGPMRCDLHPRWDRNSAAICVDATHNKAREIIVVDLAEAVR